MEADDQTTKQPLPRKKRRANKKNEDKLKKYLSDNKDSNKRHIQ